MMKFEDRDYSKVTLGIGICTYKRPQMLGVCLQSLYSMAIPSGLTFCLIIADNDPEQSGRETVEDFIRQSGLTVYYRPEPQKGIPFARNRVLKTAAELGITELIFIDDDEYVDKNWLVTLWNYYITHDVDVVWGWVKMIYPPHTPRWISEGKIYQLPANISGKQYFTAYTNNVLFDFMKLNGRFQLFFNEECGLVGDDEDFFMRASAQGAIIHYLAEAVVYEPLDDQRMSFSYYVKRIYFTKNNKANFIGKPLLFRLKVLRSGILDIGRGLFYLLLFCVTFTSYRYFKGLGYLVSSYAKVTGFLGIFKTWY